MEGMVFMGDFGILVGFIGIVVGAGITFVAEVIVLKSQMRFDMSIAVRESLMKIYDDLVATQKKILDFNSQTKKSESIENILKLREFHLNIMEIYKNYRVQMGDCKAYELESAIYKYYFELAKYYKLEPSLHSKITLSDYKNSFCSLRYALGLMINDVRFELVKINSLKKISKEDKQHKIDEYIRYTGYLDNRITGDLDSLIKGFKYDENENDNTVYIATKTIVERHQRYLKQYPLKSNKKKL